MPPLIVSPLPDQPWGIGLTGTFSADITAFVEGDFLEVELRDQVEGGRIIGYGSARDLHAPSTEITLGQTVQGPTIIWQSYPQYPASAHGTQVWLRLIHKSSLGEQKDAIVQPQIHDTISGLQIALPKLITAQASGYTEADRQEQAEIKKAVFAPLPLAGAIGAAAQIALSSLVECPPADHLVRTDPQLLSGSGTLTRPFGPIPVSAYGFTFRFEVVPPGLSVMDGRSLEFPERMAQFLAIKHDKDGLEYVSDRYDFHWDQERVCWGIPFPIRLEYWILPGVTLRFWWLLMSVSP